MSAATDNEEQLKAVFIAIDEMAHHAYVQGIARALGNLTEEAEHQVEAFKRRATVIRFINKHKPQEK